MTKKIFEELPARKHAPAAAPAAKGKESAGEKKEGGGAEGSEKRIRQAVYDIRYRARREGVDLRAAYAQYMQNSNLSAPEQAAVRAKLFGKDGGGDKKESYDATMADGATNIVANAMFKVFVEKNLPVEEEVVYEEASPDRKYKVRVTDPKNDRSYVRYATRQKITELRAKGLKVEMTEHGEPYEGQRKKKDLPNNKSGLDKPVHPSKRDGDVNDDGKKDKTDKYIYNRRDAINKAIAMRKEEFLADGTTSTEGQNKGKITGTGVDNYAAGVVKVMPESEIDKNSMKRMRGIYAHTEHDGEVISENAYSKFLTMLNEKAVSEQQQKLFGLALSVKRGQTPRSEVSAEVLKIVDKMSEEEIRKYAKTSHEGLPEKKEVKEEMGEKCEKCGMCPCECDRRDKMTYRNLLKNKLRAMGMKNPMMLDTPDDEKVMKIMTSSNAKMTAESCGSEHGKKKAKKKKY